MASELKSVQIGEFLIVESFGAITDFASYELHVTRIIATVLATSASVVIVDNRYLAIPKKVTFQTDIADMVLDASHTFDHPIRIGVIAPKERKEFTEFWAFQMREAGFEAEVFDSLSDAVQSMR